MARSLITCLLLLAVQSGAWAWSVESQAAYTGPVASLRATQGGISLSQATQLALQQAPGRVVRAETTDRGGRRVHQIRILGADGRVRTVRIDANTGRIL